MRLRVASSRRGNVAANISAALRRKLRWQCMKRLWPACQFAQAVPVVCAGELSSLNTHIIEQKHVCIFAYCLMAT